MATRMMQPFDELMDLTRTLTRRLGEGLEPITLRVSQIPLDMYETRDDVIVQAYLPGFTRDQVQIELDGNHLAIKGERPLPDRDGMTWIHVEAPYGTVFRSVTIGSAIDADKIEAAWHDGVLMIRLPKMEQARPKAIPIQSHVSALTGNES